MASEFGRVADDLVQRGLDVRAMVADEHDQQAVRAANGVAGMATAVSTRQIEVGSGLAKFAGYRRMGHDVLRKVGASPHAVRRLPGYEGSGSAAILIVHSSTGNLVDETITSSMRKNHGRPSHEPTSCIAGKVITGAESSAPRRSCYNRCSPSVKRRTAMAQCTRQTDASHCFSGENSTMSYQMERLGVR